MSDNRDDRSAGVDDAFRDRFDSLFADDENACYCIIYVKHSNLLRPTSISWHAGFGAMSVSLIDGLTTV